MFRRSNRVDLNGIIMNRKKLHVSFGNAWRLNVGARCFRLVNVVLAVVDWRLTVHVTLFVCSE